MSTASSEPFSDTMTMLWRNILHNLRAPSGVITVIGVPLIFLLFVYVFGETLGAGRMTGGTGDECLAYITPAILLMAAASATQMIAVWIAMDMSQGISARFRTMAIARGSVLAGHVYGGTILITVSIAALLGFALLLATGPRPMLWTGSRWLGSSLSSASHSPGCPSPSGSPQGDRTPPATCLCC
jgi:ABC-2 type transport system permease protein